MRIEDELAGLEGQGLLRTPRIHAGTGGKLLRDGKPVLNFSSNDYLDLANDPRLKAAATDAIQRLGCGATASRLMSGTLSEHIALENELARLAGYEAALVFGSGFLTNLGVLTALADRETTVFADRLNHASLIDGTLLSRAAFRRYRHKDMAHLEALLEKHTGEGRKLIASDSVFSMDGDVAPVAALAELARRYDALLVVDEAHAFGVLGPDGTGVCRLHGVRPDVIVGTLSKALGSYGGFAACSARTRDYLINRARSFIYSTALPPACLGAARCAVGIVRSTPGLGAALLTKTGQLRDGLASSGFDVPECESQILPVRVGENAPAVSLAKALWERHIVATAVRPPTVPAGTARLRLSVTLAHSAEDLQRLVDAMTESAGEVGLL